MGWPFVRRRLAAELNQLKPIFAVYKRYDSVIDTSQVHAKLSERLTEVLNYVREANATRLYGDMLANEAEVNVPWVIDDELGDRLGGIRATPAVVIFDGQGKQLSCLGDGSQCDIGRFFFHQTAVDWNYRRAFVSRARKNPKNVC